METKFIGYCFYQEIGALNQKQTTLHCYAPPIANSWLCHWRVEIFDKNKITSVNVHTWYTCWATITAI